MSLQPKKAKGCAEGGRIGRPETKEVQQNVVRVNDLKKNVRVFCNRVRFSFCSKEKTMRSACVSVFARLWIATVMVAILLGGTTFASEPGTSDVQCVATNRTSATVTWTTAIATVGKVKYRVAEAPDWIFTDPEAAAGTSHSVLLTGLVMNTTYDYVVINDDVEEPEPAAVYGHLTGVSNIPITGRPTVTNDDRFDYVSKMVDGNAATYWGPGSNDPVGWVRVSLASRYDVGSLVYLPSPTVAWARTTNYRVYVTDLDSLLIAD